MGVWDDLKPWRARYKLLIQIIAAVCVISGGFYFRNISIGSSFVLVRLGLFAYPLTFIWIIGVTNAINLIDGIDGLAGTISLLAITAYAIFFYSYGNSSAFYICVILVISIMGFLVFNLPFPKAKIFMGDGGSQFLGFILAVLPLLQNGNALASIPITYAAAILIIPIFDTLAAIWRRIREKRRIDDPDKLHLHHKLMLLGFSSRGTLIVLVIFQLIICLLCLVSIRVSAFVAGILLLCIYLIGVLFFTIIHIKKQEELVHKAMLQ
jgi:UDP-GlcNAc:undecaprenyl-phosphate GlcNAc-1-phosphate transferase